MPTSYQTMTGLQGMCGQGVWVEWGGGGGVGGGGGGGEGEGGVGVGVGVARGRGGIYLTTHTANNNRLKK